MIPYASSWRGAEAFKYRVNFTCTLAPRSACSSFLQVYQPIFFFANPLLFASCTNTICKWCKVTRGIKRGVQREFLIHFVYVCVCYIPHLSHLSFDHAHSSYFMRSSKYEVTHHTIFSNFLLLECSHLLRYSTVYSIWKPTFRRNLFPPSSEYKINRARNHRLAGR
jgi:hypothetical protein